MGINLRLWLCWKGCPPDGFSWSMAIQTLWTNLARNCPPKISADRFSSRSVGSFMNLRSMTKENRILFGPGLQWGCKGNMFKGMKRDFGTFGRSIMPECVSPYHRLRISGMGGRCPTRQFFRRCRNCCGTAAILRPIPSVFFCWRPIRRKRWRRPLHPEN